MAGSSLQAWSLFDLMLKTWPELLACYQELIESVIRKKLVYEPYCEEDEKPTPSSLEKQKVVATALRRMQPDATRDDSDLEGTIRDVLDAWFRGVAVSEIVWQSVDDKQVGTITAPKSTFAVDPTNYGFATDGSLGLRSDKSKDAGVWPYSTTTLNPAPNQLQPFPEHKFLIAMHKASGGSPLGGALLRPLAWWWCAANFSSDWLLNLAQLFGLPFRWVTYDQSASSDTISAIDNMLQNMGSNGWARFPVGTTMEMLQTGKEGSDHSPQGELLDRADRYARSLILGQTMTGNHGTTGKGGGQAFGTVEESVKSDRIDAAGKFAVTVINQQLVPSILMLNFGNTDEMPTLKFLEDEVADLPEAQRDKTLADAGLEIGVDYLRKKYDIPEPADGEDVIGGPKPAPSFGGFGGQDFGAQDMGNQNGASSDTGEPPTDSAAKAGDAPGHEFRGNQYTLGHPDAKLPKKFWAIRKNGKIVTTGSHVGMTMGHLSDMAKQYDAEVVFSDTSLAKRQEVGDLFGHTWEQLKNYQQKLAASDQTGHPFRGNQYTSGVTDERGFEIKKDQHGIWYVAHNGFHIGMAFDKKQADKLANDWIALPSAQKAAYKARFPQYQSKMFPSLLPSEENKRRLMRNAGLQTKLLELNAIKDDTVFSKELLELCQQEQK